MLHKILFRSCLRCTPYHINSTLQSLFLHSAYDVVPALHVRISHCPFSTRVSSFLPRGRYFRYLAPLQSPLTATHDGEKSVRMRARTTSHRYWHIESVGACPGSTVFALHRPANYHMLVYCKYIPPWGFAVVLAHHDSSSAYPTLNE